MLLGKFTDQAYLVEGEDADADADASILVEAEADFLAGLDDLASRASEPVASQLSKLADGAGTDGGVLHSDQFGRQFEEMGTVCGDAGFAIQVPLSNGG